MIVAMIQFLGLYLLAASMQQHRGILLGGWRRLAMPSAIAIAGWLLLAVSLGTAVAGHRPIDVVTWFGQLPLACGAILLGLSFAPHLLRALLVAGLAGAFVATFF